MADPTTPRWWPREFVDGLLRAGTTTALVFGAHFAGRGRRAVRAGGDGRAAGHRRARRQRPAAAPGPADHPRAGVRRRGRARRALARQGPAALRRHPAVLAVHRRGDAGGVRGGAPRRRRRAVHLARQRERRRDRRPCAGCSRSTRTTSTPTTGTGCSGRAACWRTTCTPTDAELDLLAEHGARPSRTARRATARWAAACSRCAGTSSAGVRVALGTDVGAGTGFSLLREGLQAYFVQSAARAGRAAAHPRAPALPGHPGRGGGAGPRRAGRRPVGGEAVRRGVGPSGRRQHARRRARATRTTRTTPWRRCSRWAARRTSGGCGSAAIGCADAAVYGAASGSRDSARICRASWGTSASPVPR